MKTRPVGVTILVVLDCFGVAFYAAMAVFALVDQGRTADFLNGMSGGGTGPSPLLRMGAFLPYYFLLMAIFTTILAWGLWKLKNWTRIIVLALIALSIVGGAAGMIMGSGQATTAGQVAAGLRIALAILIFWYLSSATVRAAFRPEA